MTILLTGGGTGGHITPILAVAHELKKQNPDCRIVYVGERSSKYVSLIKDNKDIDATYRIFAGKFRRYHGESLFRRLVDVHTILLNLRDILYVSLGFFQSIVLVIKIKPNVVFLKGGFVGVPVGLASTIMRLAIVTHDSDALPGLANRLAGKWAKIHATAMPAKYYAYKPETVIQVGVLVGPQYELIDARLQKSYRAELGISDSANVVMVTGGSGGAKNINDAVSLNVVDMLDDNPDLFVVHIVGQGKLDSYEGISHERLRIHELVSDMHLYSGSADFIVTRAGANTIAEFGVQKKPCIVIPNPLLTGGHQLLNAEYLHQEDAAIIFNESELKAEQGRVLCKVITDSLKDKERLNVIAKNLNRITIKNASQKLADILIQTAQVSK